MWNWGSNLRPTAKIIETQFQVSLNRHRQRLVESARYSLGRGLKLSVKLDGVLVIFTWTVEFDIVIEVVSGDPCNIRLDRGVYSCG